MESTLSRCNFKAFYYMNMSAGFDLRWGLNMPDKYNMLICVAFHFDSIS